MGHPRGASSDPRHSVNADTEFNEGSGGDCSRWPEQLGLAATFDPQVVKGFGSIASEEYRAMGMSLTLSPQADLGTEPRWMRYVGTFGESAELVGDMTRAYIDGFQTTEGSVDGWGSKSVATMPKHWPGGGPCEAGRDAHFGYGKYAVFPGGEFDMHLRPFLEGAFNLDGKTKTCASIMPYYSISYDQDKKYGENVGNSYSKYLITDLLREKYGYDGIVCTDWCITADEPTNVLDILSGDQCWGVEDGYTVAERHYKCLLAGVDQFGGNKDPRPVLDAYDMMVRDFGEERAQKRFRASAYRILLNMFRLGLFENAYSDPSEASRVVGCDAYCDAASEAQRKSVVMLKNNHALPVAPRTKVYVPERTSPKKTGWYEVEIPEFKQCLLDRGIVAEDFEIVDSPSEAEVALVRIKAPERDYGKANGYDVQEVAEGGTGYVPISLQYRPYRAAHARPVSIAGDPREGKVLNRTYRGKGTDTINESDLDLVIDTKQQMGEKPVVVIVSAQNPFVPAELEPYADALLVEFGVTTRAIEDILAGAYEPSGLLPMQLPRDMETVESQFEDVAFDMDPYVDAMGHAYDFAYGMNWSGVIDDERTRRYRKSA